MLKVLFYHDIDAHVRYAIYEVLGHLGVPFAEFENPDVLARLNPTSTVLVLPETSRISSNLGAMRSWLRGCSVLMSAELLNEKYGDIGIQLLGGSVSRRTIGGNDPPEISGFLNLPQIGTLPVFYPFVYLEANGPCTMEGVITGTDGTKTPAFCWYRSGRNLVVVYAIQAFRNVAYLLEGCEAGLSSQDAIGRNLRDVHGNIMGRKTELGRRDLLNLPIVNYYERFVTHMFSRIAQEKDVPFVRKSHYPYGKSICICPSHDVDRLYKDSRKLRRDSIHEARRGRVLAALCCFLLAVLSSSPKLVGRAAAAMNSCEYAFVHELKRLLGISSLSFEYLFNRLRESEREFGAASTFFFLSNPSRMDSDYSFHDKAARDIMAGLVGEKCEIALHGSYSSSDLGGLDREKRDLQGAVSGAYEIVGVRQHYLRLIGAESWRRQVEAGFAYDSSFGYDDAVGFKAGCCLPFRPFDPTRSSAFPIWEIPPIIQDWTLHFRHGLDMASGSALQYCKEIAKRVFEVGGVLTLIWHPAYDDELFPRWNKTYQQVLEYCSTLNPWYVAIRDLAEWWEIRNQSVFGDCSWKNNVLVIKICSPCAVPGLCLELTIPRGRELKDITHSGAASLRSVRHLDGELFVTLDMKPGDAAITVNTQATPSPRG